MEYFIHIYPEEAIGGKKFLRNFLGKTKAKANMENGNFPKHARRDLKNLAFILDEGFPKGFNPLKERKNRFMYNPFFITPGMLKKSSETEFNVKDILGIYMDMERDYDRIEVLTNYLPNPVIKISNSKNQEPENKDKKFKISDFWASFKEKASDNPDKTYSKSPSDPENKSEPSNSFSGKIKRYSKNPYTSSYVSDPNFKGINLN